MAQTARTCIYGHLEERDAVALGFAAAVPAAAEQSGHRVFRAAETIRFERKCADATPHQVQAFAELESEDTRARALVLVYTRHDAVRRDDIFIGIRLVALRIDTGEAGALGDWSLRMEAQSPNVHHVGAEHTHYDSNPASGEGVRRPFRTDPVGTLSWVDFSETGDGGAYPRHWSPEMEVTAAELGLTADSREVPLDLVLSQTPSVGEVRLRGPTIRVPDRIWHERPPRPRKLGLVSELNPFQPGGIWRTLTRGAKYRGCIEERRSAKRRFASDAKR